MERARRHPDEPPPERDAGAILADCEAAREVFTAAARQLAEMAGQPYNPVILGAAVTGLRQGGAVLDRYVSELHAQRNGAVISGLTAAMRTAAEPRPARRRRRGGRHSGGQFEVLPGGKWKGAAVSGPAALKIASALTAAATVVAVAPHFAAPSPPPSPAAGHARAFGGLAPTVALPVASPLQRKPYAPRHAKPSADAATVAPVPVPVAVAVPSPQEPSAVPSVVAGGVLNAVTMQLSVGLNGHGQISFSATGGPVTWSAQPSDPSLSVADASGASSGTLAAGETEILYVTVKDGALAGAGTVTVTTGDGQQDVVPVTWISLPVL